MSCLEVMEKKDCFAFIKNVILSVSYVVTCFTKLLLICTATWWEIKACLFLRRRLAVLYFVRLVSLVRMLDHFLSMPYLYSSLFSWNDYSAFSQSLTWLLAFSFSVFSKLNALSTCIPHKSWIYLLITKVDRGTNPSSENLGLSLVYSQTQPC